MTATVTALAAERRTVRSIDSLLTRFGIGPYTDGTMIPFSVQRRTLAPAALVLAAAALAGCGGRAAAARAADGCYRPHLRIGLDLARVQPVATKRFEAATGNGATLVLFAPGPWPNSYYFAMARDDSPEAIAASHNIGVIPAPPPGQRIGCFILSGGAALPDRTGQAVWYNYFAEDQNGDGIIDRFTAEDLDLDEDGKIDADARMVLTDLNTDGVFDHGEYVTARGVSAIPREGANFMLRKPLWNYLVPFPDDTLKRMNIFDALQELIDGRAAAV